MDYIKHSIEEVRKRRLERVFNTVAGRLPAQIVLPYIMYLAPS